MKKHAYFIVILTINLIYNNLNQKLYQKMNIKTDVLSGVPTAVDVWVGLVDSNPFQLDIWDLADSGWKWSDQSPLPFINWKSGITKQQLINFDFLYTIK